MVRLFAPKKLVLSSATPTERVPESILSFYFYYIFLMKNVECKCMMLDKKTNVNVMVELEKIKDKNAKKNSITKREYVKDAK